MKTIKFRPALAQLIFEGKKTTTWRLFDDKDLKAGDDVELMNWETKEVFGHAVITEVSEKAIKDLDSHDWEGHERFLNDEAMYTAYRTYYPGREIGPNTLVKILHFKLMSLADEIKSIPISLGVATDEVAKQFLVKLDEGGYSRDEDPINHFGTYFLLYNPVIKKVFITHHKKSGLWLFPGGHVDRGETTIQTLKREMHEELGVIYNPPVDQKPFLLTITRMNAVNYKCKTHFDVWYSVPTDGSDFKIDPSEFHDTKWVSVDEARKLMVDEQNLQALSKIAKMLSV